MSESEKGGGKAEEFLSTETGARMPKGSVGYLLLVVPFAWSLFQIWYSSPLPFVFGFGIFNSTEARAIHLGFAIFLAFLAFPALKRSPRDRVPTLDWVLALLATASVMYLMVFYEALSERPGNPTWYDIAIALVGLVLLLEATRRALGPPLMVVALVFLGYVFLGQYAPDVIAHQGRSLGRVASHMWLTTEGVFGVALGVATDFVFLFVLFGALLERAGAGSYFIKVAFAMLGRYRGGPAKAAVVASGLTGVISGSSIANVVTTGTFTIPLMKRVGFPGTKAGAVEVAASTNGQLTPPVMGAAAFLMVEYVGIPYLQVIQHAILPALISYVALLYMVHLEAVKLGMQPMRGPTQARLLVRLLLIATNVVGIIALSLAVYYGVGWTKDVFGDAAAPIVGAAVIVAYVALVRLAARQPSLEDTDVQEDLVIPPLGPTVRAGLYFLLPVAVLVWCLMVERFSPGLSAFWAVVFMIAVSLTHRPLLAFFQRDRPLWAAAEQGLQEFVGGMIGGARNMIGIGVATATAGIVVGTVTLTGIGLVMTEFVEFISGGNLMLILFFTAVLSLILGMGLPTTANYIVVSTLMAPVVVDLGAQNGLVVPLIAVHMFVFYFGILADDTPPVGLAAFAASAISGADPIRTGVQGFAYDIRTAILPFMFIFNTQLLLIGLTGWVDLVVTVVSATLAMLVFSAATQGFWITRSRWYETAALLLITFTLFRPGFWWDDIYPPFENRPGTEVFDVVEQTPAGRSVTIEVSGLTVEGNEVSKAVLIPLDGEAEDPRQRLQGAGMSVMSVGDRVQVQNVRHGTAAQRAGVESGFTIDGVRLPVDRPPKELATIPALALLGVIGWVQYRRRQREGIEIPAATARATS